MYSHFIYLYCQILLKTRLLVFTVKPWSKPLVNTFCSSLGSTLLFIKSTTIHPIFYVLTKSSNTFCSSVFKFLFKHLKCQKFIKQISTYFSIFYVLTKSSNEKPMFFVSCVKRQNFLLKNSFMWDIFLYFFTQATKISIFLQTWRAHIKCWAVSVRFLFEFFLTFQNVIFRWQEHMLPCDEINFHAKQIYKLYCVSSGELK
jgi:hypothetical protein